MSHQDVVFFRNAGLVLGALVLAALLFFITAQWQSEPSEGQLLEARKRDEVNLVARIRPVGQVRVAAAADSPAAEAAPAPAPAAPTPAPAAPTPPAPVATPTATVGTPAAATEAPDIGKGKTVYEASCFACHGTGAAGAPKLGDKAAWEGRLAKGLDALLAHAVNGFQGQMGIMPPKGGAIALSEEEVRDAVAYMMAQGQ